MTTIEICENVPIMPKIVKKGRKWKNKTFLWPVLQILYLRHEEKLAVISTRTTYCFCKKLEKLTRK